jgi:hypothetical protein
MARQSRSTGAGQTLEAVQLVEVAMREYGKVYTAIWASPTFRALSEDGRTLAMYLLTCPHGTIAGVFRLPDGYVCEDLIWDQERVRKGFENLEENGFANRCARSKWVWVRKFLEWNQPENPNQRKAVNKMIEQVPADCSWKQQFMASLSDQDDNHCRTVEEPFLNQEQEQEQEIERGVATRAKRGTRLPNDWSPGPDGIAFAAQHGLTNGKAAIEASKFRDFWTAKAGQGGTKLDWDATWRNWVRRASESLPAKAKHDDDPFRGAR